MKENKPATAFDWQAVHRKLAANQQAIEAGWQENPQTMRKILHQRALSLAREAATAASAPGSLAILEFLLADEKYGLDTAYVREVYPLTDITPLPGTPAFVLGIINVRGQILSVLNLKKFFDLPQKGLTDLNKVIILHDEKMEFGILADVILGIRKIAPDKIQPASSTLTGICADYLCGVTEERLVVLDAQKILADEKIIVKQGDLK